MGSAALEPQRGVQEGTGREPQEGLQEGRARREPQMEVQEGSGASGGCAGGWGQGEERCCWPVGVYGVPPGGILRQEVWKQQVSFCMLWS